MKPVKPAPLPQRRISSEPDPKAVERFIAQGDEPQAVAAAPPAKQEPVKTKRLTLDLPVDLHRKFRDKAYNEDISMMQILVGLVEKYVAPPK